MKNKNLKSSRFPFADNDKEYRINEISALLIELVVNMTEIERKQLLNELEKEHQSKYTEKRQHPRKQVFIYVNCSSHKYVFGDFIHNISRSGLYIETEPQTPLLIGQKLAKTFILPDTGDLVKIRGNIVRIDSKGIGVHFDEPLSTT
ncbi:MAG: PilZ domain-containing protein [Desulfobacteraceae bacterium]|nr:MAG: PilZ domain-containing protein [Desulfobacteraceae bacterium]